MCLPRRVSYTNEISGAVTLRFEAVELLSSATYLICGPPGTRGGQGRINPLIRGQPHNGKFPEALTIWCHTKVRWSVGPAGVLEVMLSDEDAIGDEHLLRVVAPAHPAPKLRSSQR